MAASHAENSPTSTLEIPDADLLEGVQSTISAGNNFVVYAVLRSVEEDINKQTPRYIHEVAAKSPLYNDFVRKLVSETHSIFLSLNSKIQVFQDEKRRKEISKLSQQYRSVLLVCIEDLYLACTDFPENDDLDELKQTFSDIELLWHLLHCLIIDSPSASLVLYKLLDWMKWHFVYAERKREELIHHNEEPCEHPEYWDTIVHFLLQGKISSARSLLLLHRKSQREDFVSLDELLDKMPLYGTAYGISLNEFRMRWKYWQDECKTRFARAEFCADKNLELICRILCGDHEALTEKSYLCDNWYHLMISVLLYTDPCINISTLGDVARTYYNNVKRNSGDKSNIVDSIILAAMELDITSVVNISCSFNDGWWFATHLMDLLCHGNFIQNDLKYRSFLIQNYSDALMCHKSLWQVGIDYLDNCINSHDLLETYLERIPLKTDAEARKIIHLAKKRNLDNLAKSVANVMTQRALSNGHLGIALTWVTNSKEVPLADQIADRWLTDYANDRKMEGFESFKNMGACMLVSDKLTFIGKYCEFHKLYNDGELKAAAVLLVSLLASGLAPSNFQMIMLIDALPLLESTDLIFSSKETHELMRHLEDAIMSNKRNSECEDTSDQESIIRLALVRNLTRSYVMETEDSETEELDHNN